MSRAKSAAVLLLLGLALVCGMASAIKEEYYLVRQDTRKCAFPKCGGFFLDPVNVGKFDCPRGDDSRNTECYVAEIRGIPVGANLGLVRGRFVPYNNEINAFQAVEGYEAKVKAHSVQEKGVYLAVSDASLVCVTTPCNTFHANKLNEGTFDSSLLLFAELDLGRFKSHEEEVRAAMRQSDVIVSAGSYAVEGPGGSGRGLRVYNYFVRASEPPKPCAKIRDCSKSEYCAKESCEAATGVCKIRPSSCTKDLAPVCACDGLRQYDNDCIRQLVGVMASTAGKCPAVVQ